MNKISTKKDILPLIELALPLALTGLVQSAVWFFETLFLARLNEETLAAGSVVSWLFGTLIVILFGTLSSINILVSRNYGNDNKDGIAWVARDGLVLAAMLSIPAIILFWNMAPIFLLFGQPERVVILAASYLQALSWGILPNFMTMACLEVLIGIGRSRVILAFSLLSVTLNIFASYVLIFGKWGFPVYGITGAGWGITVSSWISALVLVVFIQLNKNYKIYFRHLFSLSKLTYIKELLQVGVPMGLMYCVEVAFFFVLTLFMGFISSQMQAANQIALQYLSIFMSIMFAMAQAVTVRMGHLLGSEKYGLVKKVNYIGISLAIILMSLVAIMYWIFPTLLISIDFDIKNPNNFAIINQIKGLLAVSAIFQILESVRITLFGSLRSLKDTKFTLYCSIISFWGVALPLGYFISIHLNLGSRGFWWAMSIGAALSIILLQWRFNKIMNNYSLYLKR